MSGAQKKKSLADSLGGINIWMIIEVTVNGLFKPERIRKIKVSGRKCRGTQTFKGWAEVM